MPSGSTRSIARSWCCASVRACCRRKFSALTAEETNRHLHVLSILTTLLLPPTLVTGVFGMNIKGLPLVENDHAFLWVSALMIGTAAAVYLLIRRIGVFKL